MLAILITLSGCAGKQVRTNSSVIDYLYPKESKVVIQPSVPTLHLPLKVGIAFVPENQRSKGLTENRKIELLEKIAAHFRGHDFIREIEVIPSDYLTPRGSFTNLDQIQQMYDIDVIALVSYDQVQFTDEGLLSLTYWTLIGAYVVSGEKNSTNTLLDTAVYDINSKKMLFRAPGSSHIKGTATPVNASEELRQDSVRSFTIALEKMISNLDKQLEKFQEKIKQHPDEVKLIQY